MLLHLLAIALRAAEIGKLVDEIDFAVEFAEVQPSA